MKLSDSRHRDIPGSCVRREHNVTSTFASQPVDGLHGGRIYAAATHSWVEVDEGKERLNIQERAIRPDPGTAVPLLAHT